MTDISVSSVATSPDTDIPVAHQSSEQTIDQHLGRHVLVDCRNVPREVCLDDKRVLQTMAEAAERAGANVISQVRYRSGADSPPGFTAAIVLDESHCTAHSYADLGLIAVDVFTCGQTDPHEVLAHIRERIDLGDVTVTEVGRFRTPHTTATRPADQAAGGARRTVDAAV